MGYQLSQLEKDIKNLYSSLGVQTPQDIDMFSIAVALDVWIHFRDHESDYACVNGMFSILLDERDSPEEQWEDFGHELGHVFKHVGMQHKMNKPFRDLQENQANSFMYHFCVPTFMLLNYEFPHFRQQAIYSIANDFNVTPEFAAKRIEMFENKKFEKFLFNHPYTYIEKSEPGVIYLSHEADDSAEIQVGDQKITVTKKEAEVYHGELQKHLFHLNIEDNTTLKIKSTIEFCLRIKESQSNTK